ncbi:MAG: peptidylprolyl isomerase [Planctomycetota bacterium]
MRARGPVVALLFAACAPARPAGEAPSSLATPSGEVVGWLAGIPVTLEEVGDYLKTKDPEAFARGLEGTVLERAARLEAARGGVVVPDAVVSRETTRRYKEWEKRLAETSRDETGQEADPEQWLLHVAGLTVPQFRAFLRRHTEVELLQDRLIRFEQLASPRVEVSILVVDDAAAARELAGRLRAGADFTALARERSLHATAPEGGRIEFPLLSDDFNEEGIATALLAAEPGEIAGPFATRGGGKPFHQIYRVEACQPARRGGYASLEAEIAGELATRPVHVGEYERWRRRVLLRHGFVGAPPPGDSG